MLFDLGHNVVNCGAIEPVVPILRIVAAARSVETEKTSQAVKPQFPLEDREGMALKVLVRHSVDGDHDCTSRYHDTGFSTRRRSRAVFRPARRNGASVCWSENVCASLLGAGQVERVKGAESIFFNFSGAIGDFLVRNNYFASE